MWLLAIHNVDGTWSIRQGTPNVKAGNLLGCTVDTFLIHREGVLRLARTAPATLVPIPFVGLSWFTSLGGRSKFLSFRKSLVTCPPSLVLYSDLGAVLKVGLSAAVADCWVVSEQGIGLFHFRDGGPLRLPVQLICSKIWEAG